MRFKDRNRVELGAELTFRATLVCEIVDDVRAKIVFKEGCLDSLKDDARPTRVGRGVIRPAQVESELATGAINGIAVGVKVMP